MPSVFGHGIIGVAAGSWMKKNLQHYSPWKIVIVSFLASNLPDIDVLFHHLNLSHIEFLDHRNGFFHSIFFALISGPLLTLFFFKKCASSFKIYLSLYFCVLVFSHGIFDAMTKGVGVAFFYPVVKKQYFMPITPLLPAGFNLNEFTENGAIFREIIYIWIPMIVLTMWAVLKRKKSQFL